MTPKGSHIYSNDLHPAPIRPRRGRTLWIRIFFYKHTTRWVKYKNINNETFLFIAWFIYLFIHILR
jgi:hypothetical protein